MPNKTRLLQEPFSQRIWDDICKKCTCISLRSIWKIPRFSFHEASCFCNLLQSRLRQNLLFKNKAVIRPTFAKSREFYWILLNLLEFPWILLNLRFLRNAWRTDPRTDRPTGGRTKPLTSFTRAYPNSCLLFLCSALTLNPNPNPTQTLSPTLTLNSALTLKLTLTLPEP